MKAIIFIFFFLPMLLVAEEIKTLPGFKVEKIYQTNQEQGSWISICFDPKGNAYTCDERGDLFYLTFKNGKISQVKKVKSPGRAHGLLWAFDSLYLMSNGSKTHNGLNRLQDTNGDGQFDKIENIVPLVGKGGHGPHTIIKTHDKKGLLIVCGNYVSLPENIVYPKKLDYREDTLLPHLKDANGHASRIKAPGGFVLKIKPDGSEREVVATGFRNTYDIALSPTGELFGYDADMEWDAGTPWYRPTRVTHIVRNGENGWRTGTSKWPSYYPDSVAPILNIGPGSPTGVLFGTDTKFPQKYRDSLLICDWTFGRIYAVHLKNKGASFSAAKEVLVAGKPLPMVSATIGPDGAVYFVTGGRKIISGLYKLSYSGDEKTDGDSKMVLSEDQKLRKKLESFHEANKDAVSFAWPHLKSKDRFIRYAARVVLEFQDSSKWSKKFYSETSPEAIITAAIAMARTAPPSNKSKVIEKLLSVDFTKLSLNQKLSILRAYSLVFIRMGEPEEEVKLRLTKLLNSQYPAADSFLNRELCRVLVYLESNQVIAKSILLMKTSRAVRQDIDEEMLKDNEQYGKDIQEMQKNSPDAQGLHYALLLRNVKKGWTNHQLMDYFKWLKAAENKNGGRSIKGFVKNIRNDALKNHSDEVKKQVASITSKDPVLEKLPNPQGPGRIWTQKAAVKELADLSKANVKNGKVMYKAVLCFACHTFKGEGGSAGPDLTNLGNRFKKADIIDAILRPSAAVAEQYQNYIVNQKDGSSVSGKIMDDTENFIKVATNPFDFSQTFIIEKSKIKSINASKHSAMPPGLINSLNPNELRDLVAFLIGK